LGAFDFFYEEADLLKHAADLPIAAFDENDFIPGIGSVFDEANFPGRSFDTAPVIERNGDARAQALDDLFGGLAANFDEIGFGDVRASLGEFLSQGAIVGHEQ
jgi:hypothetical protein